jgi:RimJ/RimL family protein N-acetyltransferase
MTERLRAGDACYAIRDGEEGYGAFVWVATGRSFHIPEVRAAVWVPEDVSYFYEAFTFPEMRGRGLMSGLLSRAVADLAETRPPDHRCEAWVARRNKASVRSFQKAGFEPQESFVSASAGPLHLSVGRPWLREGAL